MLKTKHLTIMFTDMKGFTVRTSTQSRQQLQHLLELQDELIKPAIKHFDGTIVKTVGDAFLVTFRKPDRFSFVRDENSRKCFKP